MAIDPYRIYESGQRVTPVIPSSIAAAVAANTLLVGPTTGDIIRVMGWEAIGSTAVVGAYTLKNGSGGATMVGGLYAPGNGAGISDKHPIVDSGYFELTSGVGLYVDVTVAAINFVIYYIRRPA